MPPAPFTSRFGNLRRKNRRLGLGAVVVRLEVDRILVDIAENRERRLGQPRLGISIGRRGIAVDRAEIALPVDQRHAHGEILRHPDHRVVNRLVAMRMIFTDHVTDDARGFDVLLVRRMALLVHRVQNAPMHRLQPVARIRQRARHDHAHGVIEVGAFHLVEDGYGTNVRGPRWLSGLRIFRVRQRGNPVSFSLESYSVSGPFKPPLNNSRQPFFPSFFQRLTRRTAVLAEAPEPAAGTCSADPASAAKTGGPDRVLNGLLNDQTRPHA